MVGGGKGGNFQGVKFPRGGGIFRGRFLRGVPGGKSPDTGHNILVSIRQC